MQPSIHVKYKNLGSFNYASPGTAAATSWNTYAYGDFDQVTTGYSGFMTDSPFGETGRLGYAAMEGHQAGAVSCGSDGIISSWITYWNNDEMDGKVSAYKRSVMAHELGHILGLGHQSGTGITCSTMDLMFASGEIAYVDCGIYNPTLDEAAGIISLYY